MRNLSVLLPLVAAAATAAAATPTPQRCHGRILLSQSDFEIPHAELWATVSLPSALPPQQWPQRCSPALVEAVFGALVPGMTMPYDRDEMTTYCSVVLAQEDDDDESEVVVRIGDMPVEIVLEGEREEREVVMACDRRGFVERVWTLVGVGDMHVAEGEREGGKELK